MSKEAIGTEGMSDNQFAEYAEYYDLLYRDKDYAGESEYISGLIRSFHNKSPDRISVLDLACGTGRHAMELVKLGYNVDGSDISKDMINVAVSQCREKNIPIDYFNESFQTCSRINKKYDVALAMFAAINYLTTYDDLALALGNISTLMNEGGIFIYDFWNGNAVIESYSPSRVKRMSFGNNEVVRKSQTSLDRISQIATVKFHFTFLENGAVKREFDERHLVRYFFIQEMTDLLKANNFEVVKKCPFMHPEDELRLSDWNVTFIVKKTQAPPRIEV